MRNLTNTFENVNNRNITNSINTNTLLATLPLELNNNGLDDVISLKGLSNIGSASQYLRMNNAGTGLEFITLNLVDLNSTQTLTNKTFSTACEYTGERISKAHLDTTLVDTSTSQTLTNKTLQNCSLNHNSNQTTNIGSNSSQTNINGFLNLNSGNDRAVISYNADDNHSIFLRKDISGVDNRISFYEWDAIKFYTGARSTNASAMPLRFSINEVGCEASGNLSVVGEITGNTVSVKELFLYEQADNGSNYINIKPPADMSSNFTVNVKAESGTLALITDLPTVPTITATTPMNITNNVISLGGLTNFGSSGQVITSTGSGFTYSTPSSLTNSDVLFLVRTQAEDISTFAGSALSGFPPTDIGSTTRNVNITSDLLFCNFVGATMTISNNSAEKFIIASSQSTLKNQLLVSNGSKSSITTDAICEFSKSGLVKVLLNSEATGGDCELAFQTINNSTTYSGRLYYRNNDRGLDLTGFSEYNFEVGSTNKFIINSGINISKNVLLVSNSATSRDDNNTNFEVNNGSGFTKMLLKTTATNQEVELAMKNGNSQGNIKMLSSDNSLEFNSFSGYIFKDSSELFIIKNSANISKKNLLISDNSTGLESNYKFQMDSSDNTKMLIKTTATNKSAEIVLKNGTLEGSLSLNVFNSLEISGFTGITLNNRVIINYNNADSFLKLMSATGNAKIGFNFFQDTTEGKLYMDFSNGNLVFETNNGSNQRIQILGSQPELVDSSNNVLVGKDGNGVQLGNSSMNTFVNTSSYFEIRGDIDMLKNKIRVKDQGDNNHYIAWTNDDSIDGPKVVGYLGVGAFTRYGLAYRAKNDGTTPKLCAPNGMSCNSDDRIKFNEVPVINAIDTIKKLKPVYYNKSSELDFSGNTTTLPTEYGFIAQDTYNNVPELRQSVIFNKTLPRNFVNEDLNGDCVEDIYNETTNSDGITNTYRDICGFNYDNLHAINVKAIQELLLEIQLLKNRISQLESSSS